MQTILIVDDDEEIRSILQKSLSGAGFSVSVALGGEEAIRLCRSQRVDLIILDIWMPEKDGIETIMDLRRGAPEAKIIAISGGGKAGNLHPLDWALRLGAIGTLAKPFTFEQLLAAISDALAPKSSRVAATF